MTILTSIYIKCNQVTTQLSIFYPRGNFLWVPEDNFQAYGHKKMFNDYPRGFNK